MKTIDCDRTVGPPLEVEVPDDFNIRVATVSGAAVDAAIEKERVTP